jgi:hypothetical protein
VERVRALQIAALIGPPADLFPERLVSKGPRFEHAARTHNERNSDISGRRARNVICQIPDPMDVDDFGHLHAIGKFPHRFEECHPDIAREKRRRLGGNLRTVVLDDADFDRVSEGSLSLGESRDRSARAAGVRIQRLHKVEDAHHTGCRAAIKPAVAAA